MVLLPVDEAYAFDYFAILCVKQANRVQCEKERHKCESFIRIQIGSDKFDKVVASDEFAQLHLANTKVWNMVDMAIRDDVKASNVDAANQLRFKAKKALQQKWFGNELSEKKGKH